MRFNAALAWEGFLLRLRGFGGKLRGVGRGSGCSRGQGGEGMGFRAGFRAILEWKGEG